MLVLTRKPGETIMIDDNIEITIVQIKDDKVRVGLLFPKIYRYIAKNLLMGGRLIQRF